MKDEDSDSLLIVYGRGGKLIMLELTNPESVTLTSIFGLLPGWWLGREMIWYPNLCLG